MPPAPVMTARVLQPDTRRTIVVQNAGTRVLACNEALQCDDFHKVFHSFCVDRVTKTTVT
jgi:hypothetical protein